MPVSAHQPGSSLYRDQRESIVKTAPALAEILPAEPPVAEAIPKLSFPDKRRLFLEAANNHAQLILIYGWGDGSVLLDISGDPFLRGKQIIMMILAGEENAFAHTFTAPVLEQLSRLNMRLYLVRDRREFDFMAQTEFARHHDIARLAGANFISEHPLCGPAQDFRRQHLQSWINVLSDRTYMYGDDILDSYAGMENAAANAPLLLSAPELTACKGMFGGTPIISIAAGPSLKQHIDELKALQDRCILVACDAVMNGLVDAGIEPHFCTPLERLEQNSRMVQKARGTRTCFAGPAVVHPKTIEPFGDRALTVLGADLLYEWLVPRQDRVRVALGMSTGVFTVVLARVLGTGPVYLVGHDLAFGEKQSHWSGSGVASDIMADYTKTSMVISDNDLRSVPGNGGGMIDSMTLWDKFRQQIGIEGLLFKQEGRELINVNAHYQRGALIDHTASAPLPSPESLPRMEWPTLPRHNLNLLEDWRARAKSLPRDAESFAKHFRELRLDIEVALAKGPRHWDPRELAERTNPEAPVSDGNKKAFRYLFGPAFSNCMAAIQIKRKQSCMPRIQFEILQLLRSLCLTFEAASVRLRPTLEKFAHG